MTDKQPSGNPLPSSPNDDLAQRVDAIMAPSNKTAPEVPAAVLKQAGLHPDAKKSASVPSSPVALPKPATPVVSPEPSPQAQSAEISGVNLDDPATDKAVKDIVAGEGDALLAAEDAASHATQIADVKSQAGWRTKLHKLFRSKKFWIVLIVLLAVVFGLPASRNRVLGLVIKRPISIRVIDSTTNTPVSNATVLLAGKQAKTNAEGYAAAKVSPGNSRLQVRKQYYTAFTEPYSVSLASNKPAKIQLVATGRQIPVTVVNTISGAPLAGVEIKALDTSAKTDKQGKATLVLPVGSDKRPVSLRLGDYNQLDSTIAVTDQVVPQNNFKLTPIGRVYFLSDASGTLDVIRVNLDGTNRQTVFSGTGKEDKPNTSLLATRDWRYLVLKARHDGDRPALFVIDTTNNKVTQFDGDAADFNLVGWSDHTLIYDSLQSDIPQYQSGKEILKSYDADRSELKRLDQNQAEGNAKTYVYQSFDNFAISRGLVSYSTNWTGYDYIGDDYNLASKQATIRAVQSSGLGKKDYQTFPAASVSDIGSAVVNPQTVDFSITNDKSGTDYYELANQKVSQLKDTPQTAFAVGYPTFLLSPSGQRTFWAQAQNNQNTLKLGDAMAANSKQLAEAGDYQAFGWYSDKYLLLTDTSHQLYIVSATDQSKLKPLKLSDYYKPAITYSGYSYGYGGL